MAENVELSDRIEELELLLVDKRNEASAAKRRYLSAEERANELHLDLIRIQEEARASAQQNDSLIKGLRAITGALDVEQIFADMLSVLRDVLDFEDAFILVRDPLERLSVVASTNHQFDGSIWEPEKLFNRVLKGKTVAAFDVSQIPEWQQQSSLIHELAVSALHVPVSAGQTAAILVCIHTAKGFFTSRHVKLADRVAILATNALQNAELYAELRLERDKLEERVAERTREIETLARFPEENPNPVLRVTTNGKVQYSNSSGIELLRLLGTEVGGGVPDNWLRIIKTTYQENEPTKEEFEYDDQTYAAAFAPILAAGYVNVYLEVITDRKRAEEALQNSQARLAGIIESARDGIITVDVNGCITQFNHAAETIFGRGNEETVGESLEILFPARYRNVHSDYIHGFDQKGVSHRPMGKTGIVPGLRADGEEFPLEGSISQVDVSGQKYFTAIVRDISERKRVEDELREQHEFVLALVNTMAQGLIVLDEHARLEFVNPAFADMLHSTPEELIGKTPYDLTNEEDHPVLGGAWASHKAGNVESFEARMLAADGTEIYALAIGSPRYRDGQFAGSIGVVTNLTERRRIEEALQESEARTRLIVETALDAVVTMDMAGLITGWNDQAEKVFGWNSGEIIGRKMSGTIIPHQHRQGHEDGMSRYKRTGEGPVLNQRIEITALRRDGHEFPVELAITPVQIEGRTSFSAFIRDISERKLAEQTLQEAKELAEEAAEAKAAFLASMSHEIRTPLNAVIGLTGLLLDTDLNERQEEYVETVRTSGQTLLALINNILDFSKFEAGKLELEEQPFVLRDFLQSTVELLSNEARQQGLELHGNVSEETPAAFIGDVTRLRQVLVNLLSNAVKFTEVGEVKVLVSGRQGEGNQSLLHFSVVDSGIGIPSDSLERLFEAFSQVDASVTRKYGGTGLGLAICRELVELMGGKLWVESKLGEGSTFHFTVTLEITDEDQIRVEEEDLQIQIGLRSDRHLSILVAEDDAVNQMVALHTLEKLGFRADVAANGLEVLDSLHRQSYDVILMDHQMPEMDGVTATRMIRSQWPDEEQPWIIAMTAEAMEGDRERFLESGMDDYVPKPIMLEELSAALVRSDPGREMDVVLDKNKILSDAMQIEPIDLESFEERLGPGSITLLPRLVELFIQEAQSIFPELRQAAEADDWSKLESIGHRLRGSSSNISAVEFAEKCQRLRDRAKHRDHAAATELVGALDFEFQRIISWLAEYQGAAR